MAVGARIRSRRPTTGFSRDGLLEIALGLFLTVAAIAILVDIPWLALAVPLGAVFGWAPLQRRLGNGHLSGEDAHGRWRWRWLLLAVTLVAGAGVLDLMITGSALHRWIRGDGLLRLGLALALGLALVAWSHRRPDFLGYAAAAAAVFLGFEVIGVGPVNALLVTGLGIVAGGTARLAGFIVRKRTGLVRAPQSRATSTIRLEFSLRASPARAWRISRDPLRIPEWLPRIRSVRVHSDRSYELVYTLGPVERTTPVELLRSEPVALTVIQGRMPIGGRYTATTRLSGTGTVTAGSCTMEYTVPGGRFGCWVDRLLLRSRVRACIRSAIGRLSALVEGPD